jgi:transposase-like protein
MSLKQEFLNYLLELSNSDKEQIISELSRDIRKSVSDDRFSEVSINNCLCPHCKSNNIIKRGIHKNNQKFYCKSCFKRFSLKTNSIFFHTHKNIELWYQYMDLMTKKYTLREIVKELKGKISLPTAQLWRHKILSAITSLKSEKLNGIIEADETYFRESQKGYRNLTREKRKSGKSKLTYHQLCAFYGITQEEYKLTNRKRGLSNDQVCVLTAMDRSKNIFGKPMGYGKMKPRWTSDLNKVVENKSTLITDGEISYNKIKSVKHKKFVGGLSNDKTYNLGRIDQLHTSMKGLINIRFKGVATKYLDNYVNYVKILKQDKNIFETLLANSTYTTRESLKNKMAF